MTDLFDEFWGWFVRAGKPLNDADRYNAATLWVSTSPYQHAAILADVEGKMTSTWSSADYTPWPAAYLRSKAWTRVAAPRTVGATKIAAYHDEWKPNYGNPEDEE